MKKNTGVGVAAILVGCGIAIGAMAAKIQYDKNRAYHEQMRRLRNETDFRFTKEFQEELKAEMREEAAEEARNERDMQAETISEAVVCTEADFVETPLNAEAVEMEENEIKEETGDE